MKSFFVLVLVLALGAGAYFYFTPPVSKPSVTAMSTPLPAVASGPTEVSLAPTPTPVPQKHIAPKGIYFLLQPVSVTNDSGITGISVGTKVTVMNEKGKTWHVTDGEVQFDVAPEQLTNDMDVAMAIIKRDNDARAAMSAGIRAQQQGVNKTREQGADWLAKQLELQRQQQAQHPGQSEPAQSAETGPAPTGSGTFSPFGRPGP